jgi:hypothetical protein
MRGKLNRNPGAGPKPAGLCSVDVTAAATFGTVEWSEIAATLSPAAASGLPCAAPVSIHPRV